MSLLQNSLVAGALRAVGAFHPEYAGFIATVLKYAPQIDELGPIVTAGIKEGPGALAAAAKAAPALASAIHDFAASAGKLAIVPDASERIAHETNAENVAREMFGHPRMTREEEAAWMDSKSPYGQNDSRRGSG